MRHSHCSRPMARRSQSPMRSIDDTALFGQFTQCDNFTKCMDIRHHKRLKNASYSAHQRYHRLLFTISRNASNIIRAQLPRYERHPHDTWSAHRSQYKPLRTHALGFFCTLLCHRHWIWHGGFYPQAKAKTPFQSHPPRRGVSTDRRNDTRRSPRNCPSNAPRIHLPMLLRSRRPPTTHRRYILGANHPTTTRSRIRHNVDSKSQKARPIVERYPRLLQRHIGGHLWSCPHCTRTNRSDICPLKAHHNDVRAITRTMPSHTARTTCALRHLKDAKRVFNNRHPRRLRRPHRLRRLRQSHRR